MDVLKIYVYPAFEKCFRRKKRKMNETKKRNFALNIVFGPVPSHRFETTLGIDLLKEKEIFLNFFLFFYSDLNEKIFKNP